MSLDSTNWKTPANIVANVIETLLPNDLAVGVSLFIGFMPDKPANCITVIDSGGGEQDPINKIDNVSIQILGRNQDYALGYNLLNKVKAVLESIEPVTVTDEKIIGIWVKSNIAFLGRDNSNNSLFSSNYRVMIDTNKNINRN